MGSLEPVLSREGPEAHRWCRQETGEQVCFLEACTCVVGQGLPTCALQVPPPW